MPSLIFCFSIELSRRGTKSGEANSFMPYLPKNTNNIKLITEIGPQLLLFFLIVIVKSSK